ESSAAVRLFAGMERNKRVAELVSRARVDRPLLREGVNPILTVPKPLKRLNMLHHSKLLVVSLFDQEAVVLNRRCVVRIWILCLFCFDAAFVLPHALPAAEFALYAVATTWRRSSLRPAR